MISVLYVEDEITLLEIGKYFLEKDGSMNVDTSPSVHDALEKISAKRYDIIISDYAMPVMNGIEFLKTLRSGGDTTPFIIFTGRGRESVVIEALNLGADFYLEKAGNAKVQFAELMHEIRHAIQRKSAITTLEQSNAIMKATLESIDDGVLAVDRAGKIMAFNKKCGSLLKIPDDVLTINNDSRFLLDNIRDYIEDPDDFSKKTEGISKNPDMTCRGMFRRKEGQVISWVYQAQKTGNTITGRIWSFTDISDRDETERQLVMVREQLNDATTELHRQQRELEKKEEMIQKSEELMDFYTQVTADGIVTSIDGKIVEANTRFAEMLGYSTTELAGRSFFDIISPDSYGGLMDYIRSGSEGRYEFLFIHRNGSTFPVEAFGHTVTYRGYTVQVLIIHAGADHSAALPQKIIPDTVFIQAEPEKKEVSSMPVFEPLKDNTLQPEQASGLAGTFTVTAREPDGSPLMWEVGDAPKHTGEIRPSADSASLWEIDEIIELQKRRSSLDGISEDYHPPAQKRRCPRCGSVPFEPDGDWCDECGALMTAGARPMVTPAEEWHTMDNHNRLLSPRTISTATYLKTAVGILILVILMVFLFYALYSDFPLF